MRGRTGPSALHTFDGLQLSEAIPLQDQLRVRQALVSGIVPADQRAVSHDQNTPKRGRKEKKIKGERFRVGYRLVTTAAEVL